MLRFSVPFCWLGLVLMLVVGCQSAPVTQSQATTAPHLIHDVPPFNAAGLVNVVIEIPAGTNAKWEVCKRSGRLVHDTVDGQPRFVRYLPYPANYGTVPRSLSPLESGGDGDPLDVVVLGPAIERGSIVGVQVIGVLLMRDRGEQDDKLVAVVPASPFGHISNLQQLDSQFPGVRSIVELWFTNYKGPDLIEIVGWADASVASQLLANAVAAYQASSPDR
jgi:inorganic pyrophosphatase